MGATQDDLEMEIETIPALFLFHGEKENGSVAPGKAGHRLKSFHANFKPVMAKHAHAFKVKLCKINITI